MSTTLVNPYCTLKEMQIETYNNTSDDEDQFLQEINWASRWIDDFCRRDFLPHDHSATPLSVKSGWCAENIIFLPMPVRTLTKITVDGVELSADEYTFENSAPLSTAKIIRAYSWQLGPRYIGSRRGFRLPPKIELTGVFGFTPAATTPTEVPPSDLPQEVRTFCRVLASIRSGKVKREFTGADGTRQVATVRNLPPDLLHSIKRYRCEII